MYILNDKPALALAISSAASYAVHATTPMPPIIAGVSAFDMVERWVHLLGGIAAILAGLASAAWYGYSFIAARRGKK